MKPQKNEQCQFGLIAVIVRLLIFICFSLVVSCAPGATEPSGGTAAIDTEHPIPSPTPTKSIGEITEIVIPPSPTVTEDIRLTQPAAHTTLSPEELLAQVDAALAKALKGHFTYVAPSVMKLDETLTIEILLNPSLSAEELATQIVESSGLVTSTAEPGVLLSRSGGEVKVIGSQAEITPLMKAILLAEDPQAFNIQPIHDDEIQIVGKNSTTAWRWLVTAQEGGIQKLILVIYRQVKLEEQAYWRDVETYRAEIDVKVTFAQWLGSLDWKWIVGVLVTALLIPAFWRWIDRRKKQAEQTLKPERPKKKTT